MKRAIRNAAICLAVILLYVPLASGQDLSKYRNFSLVTSLVEISNQISAKPADAHAIHQSPALIQELSWWPVQSHQTDARPEPVQEILFSFYNGALYRMAVNYEGSAKEGLSADDMVQVLSAKYGAATAPPAETIPHATAADRSHENAIAFWEDSNYSLTLFRSPLSLTFQLVMLSKQLNSLAEAAINEAVKQERLDAPQKESDRVKKQAEDLEALRQTNLKAFRP